MRPGRRIARTPGGGQSVGRAVREATAASGARVALRAKVLGCLFALSSGNLAVGIMSDSTPAPGDRPAGALVVRGARTHNLKGVDLDRCRTASSIVFTGVSGSGKSSLAFDTIYAEGQRRYVESLSAYARQFLERMEKPDVDSIDGIAPAIAIRQKNSIRNPRSTVGTTTEIHDYLRLLWARVGRTICRQCGREVERESPEVVAAAPARAAGGHAPAHRLRLSARALPPPARRRTMTPVPTTTTSGRRAEGDSTMAAADAGLTRWRRCRDDPLATTLDALRRRGFGRLLVGGRTVTFDDPVAAAAALAGATSLAVIVDRLRVGAGRAVAADRFDRDRVSRGRRRRVRRSRWTRPGRPSRTHRFSERFECRTVRHRVRSAAAAAVLVQQSVRRVPDLPRLRQHHRARHESRRARPGAVDQRRRHRAVDQAALPRVARRAEARRAARAGRGSTCPGAI